MAAQTERGIPLSAVSPRYLHTNSTSHTGPFSAIAELIDNAYDPDVNAKQFWIDKTAVKGQECLTFTDNGNGMDYDKMHKMLSFGFSDKHTVRGHVPVGLYGNGFKSGSMRLGKDAIVFSKKAGTMCVGLLSQTYLEKMKAENVVVPIVVFTKTEQTDVAKKYEACLHDIQTYSLFNTKEELLSELSAINGPYDTNSTGTRIIIWNLRRTTTKELEFDFTKDRYDIQIPVDINESTKEPNKEPENGTSTPESQYSLRAYSSILYLKPRMQIIIRGQKVKTQLISKSLALVIKDTYKPIFLKSGIKITFGYNTKNKEHYGLMMYHKNRLIKAYERVACQRKANRTGVGVIGVIECNYLTPMHNKQDFENTEEYRRTIQNVSNKLEEYWKEIRHRRQKKLNSSVPAEDDVKRPDQNWVQCDKCQKWRKLPDGINTELLPAEWYCHLNPDPQFRTCTVEEEPQDSDDEQPRYQKTYKQHERNQKLQKEKDRQQMEQEQKEAEISALAKEKADLLKKNQDLLRQLQRESPARRTHSSPRSSSPHNHAGSRSPDNIPVVTQVKSLAPIVTRKRRAPGPSQENSEIKRTRIIDLFNNNTPGSPSTSTASPEVCSSLVTGSGDGDQTTWKDNETVPKDDDDILIIEDISSPRPKSATITFDINKVKSECIVSEEELGKPMEHGDSDTVVSMETTAAASPPALLPVSPRDISIGTQTLQNPVVKQEDGYVEGRKKENWRNDGVNNSNHFESEKDFPSVERNTNKELKSINEETRDQQKSVPDLQEENQERNMTKIGVNSEEELNHGDVLDEISPGGHTSAKLENSVLDVSEAQQQQDRLLELLEVASKERDESCSKLLLLSSQMNELRSELLALKQSVLKKEHSHNSTQTIPEEAPDYKELYLQGKEEIKQLQDELSELKMEKEMERKGQEASLEWDDEVACQIDGLLRELDQRNKERDELKEEVDGLVKEKCTLLTCCERLQKDLEEKKRESEKAKVNAEDQEVQTDFPVSSHEESAATSAEASNLGRGRDTRTQQHETQDRPEIKQENNNTQLYSLRLRELRQRVARLLVTFVPALDLQQVNYDCEVIDEILTQVIDEIAPAEAAST